MNRTLVQSADCITRTASNTIVTSPDRFLDIVTDGHKVLAWSEGLFAADSLMPNHYWSLSALTRHASVRERLIVALDMTDCDAALAMVGRLANEVNIFKVGRKLFASAGPGVIREIRRRGSEVFLDLKFHDTPHRVERASIGATRLGVRMFSIHPYCKLEMMTRTRAEVAKVCRLEGLRRPEIIAVAMLAGINTASCDAADDIADPVAHLAKLAASASLDGVFTSCPEVQRIRNACGRRFIIVTSAAPVRPGPAYSAGPGSATDAIRAGADYVVIGSQVCRAEEPVRAIREIVEEIERGIRVDSRPTLTRWSPRSA